MLVRLPCLALCATVLFAPSCIAPTYVNIPSEGGLAASDANSFNVRDIMADSIAAAVEREPLEGPFEILLPQDATQATYEAVVRQIGGGAIAPDTLREVTVPSVRIVAVRVRNQDAECDLVRPSPTGRSVVRVFLKYSFGGDWAVQRVRPLRISEDELVLQTAEPPAVEATPEPGPAPTPEPLSQPGPPSQPGPGFAPTPAPAAAGADGGVR